MTLSKIMDQFLDKYKELEMTLRSSDYAPSILQYEETLDPNTMEKLRICRQIRNYVQHHDDGKTFLSATEDMVAFLDYLMKSENAKKECAGDRLYRLTPLSLEDTFADALQKFAKTKREWMPLVDEKGKYLFSVSASGFLGALAGASRTSQKLKAVAATMKGTAVVLLPKDMPLEDYYNKKIVVIGKEQKYLGIVKW